MNSYDRVPSSFQVFEIGGLAIMLAFLVFWQASFADKWPLALEFALAWYCYASMYGQRVRGSLIIVVGSLLLLLPLPWVSDFLNPASFPALHFPVFPIWFKGAEIGFYTLLMAAVSLSAARIAAASMVEARREASPQETVG